MDKKTLEKSKKRVLKMNKVLKKLFPGKPRTALNWSTPWELLVATILSAQCTDKRVNIVTEDLFKKYKKVEDYVNVSQEELEKDIHSTGFYRNKAKNIRAAAQMIVERFGGRTPKLMKELLMLPGVARKTANVVLGNAWGVVEGIAVDTHVRRFALRFDLSDSKDPKKIEKDLMEVVPQSEWFGFSNRLIMYGREICPARKHECREHPLTKIYPEAANNWPKTK